MSFTGTGLEVRTRGGSLGGLTMSLMFSIKDLYHGSSISGGSRCARWSLGSEKRLFGCDRSAMFIHQFPLRRNRCLRSTIRRWPRSSRYSFWEFRAQATHRNFTTTISSAACKLSYIGLDVTLQYEVSKNSNIWNVYRDALESPATWQNR